MNNPLKHSLHENNPGHAVKHTNGFKVLAAALALMASVAHAESREIRTLDVFVDPPSAFAFIKMPQGWKFIGKLDEPSLRALPASVHTSLPETNAEVTPVSVAEPLFIGSNANNGSAQKSGHESGHESGPMDASVITVTTQFIGSNVDHSGPARNSLDAATIEVSPTFIGSNVGSASSGTDVTSGTASGAFARDTPATAD